MVVPAAADMVSGSLPVFCVGEGVLGYSKIKRER